MKTFKPSHAIPFLVILLGTWLSMSPAVCSDSFTLTTQNIEYRLIADSDPSVSTAITILSPEPDAVLFQDKVAIKGVNRWLTPVIVNGKSVPVRPDGRFSTVVPVDTGVTVIYLGVVSADGRSTTVIKRQITRLNRAKVTSADPTLVDLFYGFEMVPNAQRRDPQSFVTRGDLAYFLDRLSVLAPGQPVSVNAAGVVDIDPRSPLIGPITRSVRDGLFDLYGDGSFRADAPISRLDYTVAIVRRLSVPVDDRPVSKDNRWFSKFNRAAIKAGLLNAPEVATVAVGVTVADLAGWSARIPEMRRVYQELGFADVDADRQFFRQAVAGMVSVKRNKGLIATADPVTGYVDMSGHWLSQTLLKLSQAGRFGPDVASGAPNADQRGPRFNPKGNLTRGEFAKWMVSIYQIPAANSDNVMSDLPGDPSEAVPLATLVAAGVMTPDKRGRLHPTRHVSRVELVTMLLRVNGLVPTPSVVPSDARFRDVSKSNWAAPYLNLAVDSGLIVGGGYFYPNRLVTRAEALAMIAKTPAIQTVLKGVSND